jgi:hypothetical protein
MKAKSSCLLFIILFIVMPAAAQDMEKDTIHLKEIVVGKKARKPKVISYKFRRGSCTHHEYLNWSTESASMAYDMPKGRLKTLRFNFNDPFEREDAAYYKDTQIELNFYTVGPDGIPGDRIASKTFTVPGSHRGKMDIDVSDLAVINENGIYIALHRLTKNAVAEENEFEANCGCSENKDHKVMERDPKSGLWKIRHNYPGSPLAFQLTVTIEQ